MLNEFEDIRPYDDSEIGDAMKRIVSNPHFILMANFLYPGIPIEVVKTKFLTFDSVYSFQSNFSDSAIQYIVNKTSSGLSYDGIDYLSRSKRYLFLSNHRDILLDSAILQIILFANKHETSEITFGDNLMSSEFLVDMGKSNKMFRLVRGGTPRVIFHNSMLTSKYIRYTLNEKQQSIWIAQRNGRTKDGNDQTQQTILKMFGMSGGHEFTKNFVELNIAPIAISYEYDPGDYLKTREIYISRRQPYIKAPNEDINSVLTGIKQFKGRIHLSITSPISVDELLDIERMHPNKRMQALASLIDKRIYTNFKIWNTNLIAYDILNGNLDQNGYPAQERVAFVEYMNKVLSKIEGDKPELESIFLSIYANPVINNRKKLGD